MTTRAQWVLQVYPRRAHVRIPSCLMHSVDNVFTPPRTSLKNHTGSALTLPGMDAQAFPTGPLTLNTLLRPPPEVKRDEVSKAGIVRRMVMPFKAMIRSKSTLLSSVDVDVDPTAVHDNDGTATPPVWPQCDADVMIRDELYRIRATIVLTPSIRSLPDGMDPFDNHAKWMMCPHVTLSAVRRPFSHFFFSRNLYIS